MQSNTILSSASSLFTFLVSLAFLSEKFTWLKLISVLLCMVGTIIVSLGDSQTGLTVASNPLLGDIFALASAALYAVYITLICKKLPDDDGKSGQASMAQFLGFLGLFNLLIFLPVALILNFTKLEPFNLLTWEQFGLIIGKGLYLSFHFYYYFYFLIGDIFVCLRLCGWVRGCGCYYYYYSWLSVTFFKRVVLNKRLIPLCVCTTKHFYQPYPGLLVTYYL